MASDKPQIKVRISHKSKEWLDKKAKQNQRSLSFLVEEAISKAIRLEEMAA